MKKYFIILIALLNFSFYSIAFESLWIEKYKNKKPQLSLNDNIYTIYFSENYQYVSEENKIKKKIIDFFQVVNYDALRNYRTYSVNYGNISKKPKILNSFIISNPLYRNKVKISKIDPEKSFFYLSSPNNTKSFILNIPTLKINDALFINYEINKKNYYGFFQGIAFFKNRHIVKEKFCTVTVPKNSKFFRIINDPLINEKIKITKNTKTYIWSSKNNFKIEEEELGPFVKNLWPRVMFSTSKNWENIKNKLLETYNRKSKPTELIKNKVKRMLLNIENKKERLSIIYKFIITKYKNYNSQLKFDNWEKNSAEKILLKKNGDLKDKAILFSSFLKAAGFKTFPVLVSSFHRIEKRIVLLDQFSNICIAVELGKSIFYISLNSQNSRLGYLAELDGKEGLALSKNLLWIKLKQLNSISNSVKINVDFKFNTFGDYTAKIYVILDGFYYNKFINIINKPDFNINKYFNQAAKRLTFTSQISNVTLVNKKCCMKPIEFMHIIKGNGLTITQSNGYILLNIPKLPYIFTDLPFYPKTLLRKYPIIFDNTYDIDIRWKIKIPNNVKVQGKTNNELDIKTNSYILKHKYLKKDKYINYTKKYKINKKSISEYDYSTFKNHLQSFSNSQNNVIVFFKKIN